MTSPATPPTRGPITETVLNYQPSKLQLLQMDGMLSGRAR